MIKTSLSNGNLQEPRVQAHLVDGELKNTVDLYLCDSVDSTNDFVMSRVHRFLDGYLVCVANHQTHGRGRNGRQWQSPENSNIYMSVGFQMTEVSASSLSGLSLACGVSIANVVNGLGVLPQLKWPNDILVLGKKLAGVLIETRIKGPELSVVIGLGLNVSMSDKAATLIDQPWTDLHSNDVSLSDGHDNNWLVAQLILSLVETCNIYKRDGIQPFLKDWSKYDILKGQDVLVLANGEEDRARVIGLNNDCSLRVEVGGCEKNIYAADVKIKLHK